MSEYQWHHFCTRQAKAGSPCRHHETRWPSDIRLPDPHSCTDHLNDRERAAWNGYRRAIEALTPAPYDYSPACWSWPPPDDADRERVRARWGQSLGERTEEMLPGFVMIDWQQGRCAACGRVSVLIEDHDHVTGMIRGYLCGSCNTAEGMNRYAGRVWREYRERNPASICGVSERYWDPFTKEFAEPAPPPHDPWGGNPMRGVGL
jgi:hypothetical protein